MEERDSKIRSQAWKDGFDNVAGKMEGWVKEMRVILEEGGIRELIAREGQVEGGEGEERR